jgi:hypothetical protein
MDNNDDYETVRAREAALFSRYSSMKVDQFRAWLAKPPGQRVYQLFSGFARQWWEAGHTKCGASLIGNRIRWEMQVEGFDGYKVPNNYLPMLARQLTVDQPELDGLFNFHGVGQEV